VTIDANSLLAALPAGLREPLLATFKQIAANFVEHRWEPSELNGGKFCECVFTILDGSISGTFAAAPSKPANMRNSCQALENIPATGKPGDRSLRILIPRLLPVLYEIRNNRGVGHVGGDVDPNFMDATAVFSMSSWILAELVRIFHGATTDEAQASVDALVERKIPVIWDSGIVRRVLDTTLSASDETLLLLYQSVSWVADKDLMSSIEYSNASVYRAKVLSKLHKDRMIEYDKDRKQAKISPKGGKYVEDKLLSSG
jgi:hypothetical protein